MRNDLHTRFSAQGLSGAYPNVYFADLAPPSMESKSSRAPASSSQNILIPSENVLEVATQSALFWHREALTITQRNVNRSFSLLKRLIGIRNFGTIVDLEAAYWPDRLMAFSGQVEELSKLSTKALWDVLDAMIAPSREMTVFRQTSKVQEGHITSLKVSGDIGT
jgi:hypothetical protein